MLTQFSPEGDKLTLADLKFEFEKDVYPVGRLDYNSEGLLLLTNDKSINKRLLHPTSKVTKTYYVQVEGEVNQEQINQLEQGVTIKAKGKTHRTAPASVNIINNPILPDRNPPIRFRVNIPTTWLSITISEGKNRQVRKMTAAVGLPTLRLVRWSIGDISINNYHSGEIKHLTIKDLRRNLGL